jgi:riboflavin synthase
LFTGLIECVGTVDGVSAEPSGREMRILAGYKGLADGESIALDGVCLTVREHGDGWFVVAAVDTTLERTTLGQWTAGRRVNLERAMVMGERLGGHMVAGHVDGVATVASIETQGDARLVALAAPEQLMELSVLHGSVTVNGVSLTVNDLPPDGTLQLSLIDYTIRHTTLGELSVGDAVNVETDLIGKYVQRLLSLAGGSRDMPHTQ